MKHARFWRCAVQDNEEGVILFWGRTRKEVVEDADRCVSEDPDNRVRNKPYRQQCELSSRGFVIWLNRHFTHDNG